jgi:hypothetical protein
VREDGVGMGLAYGCAISADGARVWASFRGEGFDSPAGIVVRARVKGGGCVSREAVFWRDAEPWDLGVGAGGGVLCVVETQGAAARVAVLDGRDGGVVRVFAGLAGAVGASLDDRGEVVAVADARGLRVFDVASGAVVRRCAGYVGVRACDAYVAITPCGGRVVANGRGGEFRAWDVRDAGRGRGGAAQVVAELVGHVGDAGGCAVSADGRTVVTAGDDGTVRWWRLPPLGLQVEEAAEESVRRVEGTGGERQTGRQDGGGFYGEAPPPSLSWVS